LAISSIDYHSIEEGSGGEATGTDLGGKVPTADPTVCKIIDYKKFLLRIKRKKRKE